jgi:hypothetical protein
MILNLFSLADRNNVSIKLWLDFYQVSTLCSVYESRKDYGDDMQFSPQLRVQADIALIDKTQSFCLYQLTKNGDFKGFCGNFYDYDSRDWALKRVRDKLDAVKDKGISEIEAAYESSVNELDRLKLCGLGKLKKRIRESFTECQKQAQHKTSHLSSRLSSNGGSDPKPIPSVSPHQTVSQDHWKHWQLNGSDQFKPKKLSLNQNDYRRLSSGNETYVLKDKNGLQCIELYKNQKKIKALDSFLYCPKKIEAHLGDCSEFASNPKDLLFDPKLCAMTSSLCAHMELKTMFLKKEQQELLNFYGLMNNLEKGKYYSQNSNTTIFMSIHLLLATYVAIKRGSNNEAPYGDFLQEMRKVKDAAKFLDKILLAIADMAKTYEFASYPLSESSKHSLVSTILKDRVNIIFKDTKDGQIQIDCSDINFRVSELKKDDPRAKDLHLSAFVKILFNTIKGMEERRRVRIASGYRGYSDHSKKSSGHAVYVEFIKRVQNDDFQTIKIKVRNLGYGVLSAGHQGNLRYKIPIIRAYHFENNPQDKNNNSARDLKNYISHIFLARFLFAQDKAMALIYDTQGQTIRKHREWEFSAWAFPFHSQIVGNCGYYNLWAGISLGFGEDEFPVLAECKNLLMEATIDESLLPPDEKAATRKKRRINQEDLVYSRSENLF